MRRLLCLLLPVALLACNNTRSSPSDASSETSVPADGTSVPTDLVDAGTPEMVAGDLSDGGADLVQGEPVTLVADGHSPHVIVLQQQASPSEKQAAQELRTYVEQACGATLPIVDLATDAPPAEGTPLFVLGRGPLAASLGIEPSDEELGEQGFRWKTVPPHVVIAGTPAAGTLYGVHRFLETFVGVRWYAPGVTSVPTLSKLVIPPIDGCVTPAFLWRHTSYAWPGKDAAFLAHQGDNSGDGGPDHEWGIQHSHDGRAHSYFWYVHPDEFYDQHPEYFSEIGGVRLRDETQLCLTNPEVLDIVTERMLQRMADKPHARQHNFSQMDRYNYCQCDQCKAMNEQYGTAGGTQFWFVNELAKRTSEVYPEKLVGTLAYMYTEEPPAGLDMHPNVAVWLCHMYPSCDAHPIATCPENADYKRRAESWSTLVEHLYIWHYIVDFTHYYNPFPNFRAMAADMRFYRDIGVEGIYLQGMGHSGGGGEFSLLRPYYGMKLLWDPDVDPAGVRSDFLHGYYGAAATAIESYLERLLDEVTDKDIHMHLYTNPGQGYLSNAVMEEAESLFNEAEAAVAGDELLVERVKVARMPLTYARVFPRNGYELDAETLLWLGPIASAAEVAEFLERMAAHGFKTIREVGGDPQLLALLASIFQSPLPLKVIDNGQLRVEVVGSLGGRALRIIHKQSGVCVTASNVVPNLFFPFAGGLEDRIGGHFEAYGWVEPASVATHDDLSVTVKQNTLNGYALERTFTLDPQEPILHHTTTLTNTGGPREDRFRFHLELDLGDLAEVQTAFTCLSGTPATLGTEDIIANQREGLHFYDDDAPAGQWSFSGTNGLQVVQSWNADDFEHTWLYAYPASLNELEVELWAPKLHLEPGESVTFTHAIEVRPEP